MKKIIFFDGDGTLWYPKATKHREKPHWVYHDEKTKSNPNYHLVLTPATTRTLKILKSQRIKTIILSANPYSKKKAYRLMKEKVEYFGIAHLFDEIHATPPKMEAKGEFILDILAKYKLRKKDALMVGDTYLWDCKSAKNVGVESLLIDSSYRLECLSGRQAKRVINKLSDLLNYIN